MRAYVFTSVDDCIGHSESHITVMAILGHAFASFLGYYLNILKRCNR